MTLKIEKNIPIPPIGAGGAIYKGKYPFGFMEIGDSFFVDMPSASFSGFVGNARRMFPNMKFAQRKEGSGTRVWRIA